MLALISSAKTMTFSSKRKVSFASTPQFIKEANEIALEMTQLPVEELSEILKVNSKLAADNYLRYKHFFSSENLSLQSILAYTGVVYKNMNPIDFTDNEFKYSQDHLRISSCLYGLLRPLDLIKLYRMEFDIHLPELLEDSMYHYWRDKQTDLLINDVKASGGILINLASRDIQPSFHWNRVKKEVRVINPDFKIWKNGKLKTIVIYAKMARGKMSRHIIKNQVEDPELLKSFSWGGFSYNEELSDNNNWVFVQEI